MKRLYRHSKTYQCGRYWIRFSLKRIFYRRFEIRYKVKFNKKDPLIFAPNHQNALIDALVFVAALRQQPVFLARADVFKNQFLKTFLSMCKMLPVWRVRDGLRNVPQNEGTFKKCYKILGNNNTLILFPEGNHGDKRKIRPLKKGLARIAFAAEETSDFKLGLKVIPVGIDYSSYEKVRGRLTLSYGEPIIVADLEEFYRKDPQVGYRELNRLITERIKPEMIDIPWADIYDTVMNLRTIYGKRYRQRQNLANRTLFDTFDGDKKMIDFLGDKRESETDKMEELNNKVTRYHGLLNKLNLRDHIPAEGPFGFWYMLKNTALLIAGIPFMILGVISNYHLVKVPDYVSRKVVKDPMFMATFAYALSLAVMVPIFYALQALVVWLIFKSILITVVYFVTLLPLLVYIIHYYFWFKKWRSRLKFNQLIGKKDPEVTELITLRNEIIEMMDQWVPVKE